MKNKIIFILLTSPVIAQASVHLTPERARTLMYYSIVNFIILCAGLVYLLRKRLVVFFNAKRDKVQAIYTQAMEKQKQAQRQRDNYQMEIANLTTFEDKVMKETIGNTVKFKESYKKEIDDKITRVEKETDAKIQNARTTGEDQVMQELMDAVIADTKNTMSTDSNLKNRVTTKLLNNI